MQPPPVVAAVLAQTVRDHKVTKRGQTGIPLRVGCPEVGGRNAVQVASKGDNLCAGIEHHTANPAPAGRTGQSLQPPNVAAMQSCTGFYFHAYQMPSRVFQHDVHFLSRSRAPIKQLWLSLAPGRLLAQLILVPPYFETFGKRLIKSPKIYWVDSGLACYLLGITSAAELERSPFLGALFEGFVASEILKNQTNRGVRKELYYFRDQQAWRWTSCCPGGMQGCG
jgi:hypothetical protein